MSRRYVILSVVSLVAMFPLAWMVTVSFNRHASGGFDFSYFSFTWNNYIEVWNSGLFGRYFINSLLVSSLITVGNLFFCSMAGYFFARQEFPFKNVIFVTVLLTMIIPAPVVMVPLYVLMVRLGWLDTYWALVVPWLVNPFGIFLMRQYFERLPVAIEESAKMDGAGDFTILFKIVMPLAKPALAVLGIYIFVNSWNQFLYPFLFTDSDTMRTLPVGLAFYSGYQDIDVAHLMAGASISSIPMIVVFLLFQRQIISGLTAGAVKE
jgi:multiple sugar transport system permease protein